ncbi:hypothetical protein BK128_08390 [Viridibacillus sp. FSL H7-0596]|uniref:AAA family ATPase n=1 Tax=Viridibacillus sp. FSL H7-0596 TaxID=1928923 RepID=UPI00096E8B26|nr:AAA family ATPase [Viridibacillus sp. FSL H7-0596]OMC87435.1 hypothetical protein BK128_08390 [Viridibacillus sp. FSL H7-0596]
MNEFEVQDARREKQKALIGLVGPSGSGKSLSALRLAFGIAREAYPDLSDEDVWKKIGAADTEHKRLLTYQGQTFGDLSIGSFKYIDFSPPFTTDRYRFAIEALRKAGAEIIIVDSLSHQWQGEGGVVETHGGMQGNSFQNWGKLAPETSKLTKALTSADVHMIVTMRVKSDYVIELIDGKNVPKKVGLKPVQKDDMEYEFDTVFNIDMEHQARISKDITNLFEGEFQITEEVGSKLYRYLELGVDVQAEERERREKEEQKLKDSVKAIRKKAKGNEALEKIITDCEFKTSKQLEVFNKREVDRVIELIGGI